jgi:DNA ligase-1
MGALIVRDLKTGVEFNIGTGFTDEERAWWWDQRKFFNRESEMKENTGGWTIIFSNPSMVVKYKFFNQGSKDKPRFPAYLGLRHKEDM